MQVRLFFIFFLPWNRFFLILFLSSVVRIGAEMRSDVTRMVVMVVLQGVAGAHGHIGIEVSGAEIAAGVS